MSAKADKILRYFRITAQVIKILGKTLWVSYQIALGLVLIVLLWYSLKALNYLHWFDIGDLAHERPLTTSFIESERNRIESDSLVLTQVIKARKKMDREGIIWQEWLELDSIPRLVRDLAIIAEDGKFYEHSGFDLEQIEYALVSNHQRGKKARGASTISQQVVKNIFLSGDKNYTRKVREALMTKLLEESLDKSQILELYLNIAQFGPGVFGVKAGARHHFNKPLDSLSLEETISLIALLPSPVKWNPHRHNHTYRKHRMRILRNLSLYKKIASKIPDDMHELFLKYAQEEEDLRWASLRTGPQGSNDSSLAPNDSTVKKEGLLGKLKFWGKKKKPEAGTIEEEEPGQAE